MKLDQLKNIGKILDYSLQGYALHKIVLENNIPVDYIYLDVNTHFEKITGLTGSNIINKKITEVLPGIVNDETNWIKIFGEVAQKQIQKNFIQYSDILEKWFNVSAYSPEKGYFVAVFTDITEIKLNELQQK
ncbi:MAG: PAS domain S-box protein, partial [Bacteroidales bacterium]